MNDQVKKWQARAREEAQKHSRHELKKAVQNTTPTDEEARALYELYAEHESDIREWCKNALAKAQGEDAPPVGLEDVMAEAYILTQRSLVRFEPEEAGLRTYLQHDLRGRIRDYLSSMSEERRERSETKQESRSAIAPGFDLAAVYSGLVDEGKVPAEAADLYNRLHPDDQ
ncbi:hypothetical protein GGQ10_002115 [Salinibacter ruber]|uniref:hypothetical protein n=1 Tax=Salinibacter ruber TaxID=146919 RepID=UPI002168E53D|nr:hypothetical protein [Salinibacter ruber]MCS4087289.1 hypothetical protein [Salinibacter ruber]